MKTQKIKSLKILLIPYNDSAYYFNMLNGLASEFNEMRHKAIVLLNPPSSNELKKIISEQKIDLVLSVNKILGRNEKIKIPLFCWIQDVFPSTESTLTQYLGDNEYIYTFGDSHDLGFEEIPHNYLGSLITGVSKLDTNFNNKKKWDLDISFCGYIPSPLKIAKNPRFLELFYDKLFFISKNLYQFLTCLSGPGYLTRNTHVLIKEIVESTYKPLRGSLDVVLLEKKIREIIRYSKKDDQASDRSENFFSPNINYIKNLFWLIDTKIDRLIRYYVHTYPRYLDRDFLLQNIISSFPEKKIKIYGVGWDSHPRYKKLSHPHITNKHDLHNIYKLSKINLNNNTHGFGLHSRVLECINAGGFLMTHKSKSDSGPGGILSSFEENKHFGFYDPNDLYSSVSEWLKNDNKRLNAVKDAQKIILSEHLWRYRANQILNDYNLIS